MAVTKKRLSINLSFLNLTKQSSNRKSPKTFHDQNGVVGLQILAALNHDHDTHHQDSDFINSLSSGLVSIPPYSNLTPKSSRKPLEKKLNMEEMELCEEYTCVISHTGDNVIKKREYFDADLLGKDEVRERAHVVSGDCRGFLNTCFLCDKVLHGLDVFMYRGEKAFCSVECRHEQILIEENKEMRRRSKMRDEPLDDWSASPCYSSSPLQFFARVAAA